MLGKITGAGKGWNIFPTDQRFPICTNSMDSHFNIGTICLPQSNTAYISLICVTGYIQMPQPVFFLCTVCHYMIYTHNTDDTDFLLSLISVLITKTTDYTPCMSVLCLLYRPETVHCSTKNAYTSEITKVLMQGKLIAVAYTLRTY